MSDIACGSKNCHKCGQDFPYYLNERVCLKCKAPKQRARTKGLPGMKLSVREEQIVSGVEVGSSNKAIAYELHLTTGTVKFYLNRIMQKTGTDNRSKLTAWALKRRYGIDQGVNPRMPSVA